MVFHFLLVILWINIVESKSQGTFTLWDCQTFKTAELSGQSAMFSVPKVDWPISREERCHRTMTLLQSGGKLGMQSENQSFHLLLRCPPPCNPQLPVFYTHLNKLAQNEFSVRKVITDVKAITWRRHLVVTQKYSTTTESKQLWRRVT